MDQILARFDALMQRLDALLPPLPPPTDWKASIAFRWRKGQGFGARGWLDPVRHVHKVTLSDLQGIDAQIAKVEQNTRQFVAGKPANNVLLTGARGTGKSSMIKGLLNKYAKNGLRLIEVDKADLVDLPAIVDSIAGRERFLLYCDDLSFEEAEPGYKALKVALDGSISTASDNLLIYATSNRRHLMPEYMHENLETKHVGDEIHPGETSRGEDLAVGAFWHVGIVLSVQPGRVSGHRRALAGGSSGCKQRRSRARARRPCNGR